VYPQFSVILPQAFTMRIRVLTLFLAKMRQKAKAVLNTYKLLYMEMYITLIIHCVKILKNENTAA